MASTQSMSNHPPNATPSGIAMLPSRLLLALVALIPWVNGGADTIVQIALYGLVAIAALAMLWVRIPSESSLKLRIPALAIPVLIGILLGVIHLLPIWSTTTGRASLGTGNDRQRQATSTWWSPAALTLRSSMGADGSEQAAADTTLDDPASTTSRSRWTLDPLATEQQVALMIVALVAMVLASFVLSDNEGRRRLTTTMAASGALLTLFALFARATWNGSLYWLIPVANDDTIFGPIVYHNQAGGLLQLSIAANIHALVDRPSAIRSDGSFEVDSGRPQGWTKRTIGLAIAMIFNVLGLVLTLSRGAALAALIATFVGVLVLRPKIRWARLRIPLIAAAVGSLVLIAGLFFSGQSLTRFQTLLDDRQLLADTRLQHWRDGWQAAKAHGLLGVGLGSYRHVYPMFQAEEPPYPFLRAHQQYLETLVEAGIPGILLLLGAIGLASIAIEKLSRDGQPRYRAMAAFGAMVLVGQAMHGLVDYTLYLPGTAIVVAIALGAVVGTAQRCRASRLSTALTQSSALQSSALQSSALQSSALQPSPPQSLAGKEAIVQQSSLPQSRTADALRPRSIQWFLIVGFAACGWATWQSGQWHLDESALRRSLWGSDPSTLTIDSIDRAAERLDRRLPRTNDYRLALAHAELSIARYRVQARKQLAVENELEENNPDLWAWTAPVVLEQRASELFRSDDQASIEEMRRTDVIAKDLAAAHRLLRMARSQCPMIAQIHLRLAELEFIEGKPRFDGRHTRRAQQLSAGDPDMAFEVGRSFLAGGQRLEGLHAWRECLRLSPRRWPEIYQMVGSQLTGDEMDRELLPDDPALIAAIAEQAFSLAEQHATRDRLFDRALRLLEGTPDPPRQLGWGNLLRTRIALVREQYDVATKELEGAIVLQPSEASLRHQLARLYWRGNRFDEAIREARLAARLAPQDAIHAQLLDQIFLAREAAASGKPTAPQGPSAAGR
jgi:O-antigen ligase/tetratricopeptide (TPR) repeat protein